MQASDVDALDISVVIPAYNRERLIWRAVLSALGQQPSPREVVVVDDGSTDATADTAERLGATVVRQANAGEGAARNAGLATATSSWVAFLDSDDEWLPQHLATLYAQRAGHVLVGSAARCVPSGRRLGSGSRVRQPMTAASILWPQCPVVPSTVMVRRDIALQVGGFRSLPTAADLDFFIRVLEHGSGVVLPDATVLYFEHGGQISTDNAALKQGRNEVLRDYQRRPWFPGSAIRDVEVSDRWDALRTAQRAHDWPTAAALAAGLARPRAVRALADVWRHRYAARHW